VNERGGIWLAIFIAGAVFWIVFGVWLWGVLQ
jgi:hypothetical protein